MSQAAFISWELETGVKLELCYLSKTEGISCLPKKDYFV